MLALSVSDKFCCFGIFVFVFNRLLFSRFSFVLVFITFRFILVFVNEFVIFSFFTIFVFNYENYTGVLWGADWNNVDDKGAPIMSSS